MKNKNLYKAIGVTIGLFLFTLIGMPINLKKAIKESEEAAEYKTIPIPEFSFPLVSGGTLTQETIQNKKGLLVLWASWCLPCIQEIKELKKTKFPEDWEIFLINKGEEKEVVDSYLKKNDLPYPVAYDFEGKFLDIEYIPFTLFFKGDKTFTGPLISMNDFIREGQAILEGKEFKMTPEKVKEELLKTYHMAMNLFLPFVFISSLLFFHRSYIQGFKFPFLIFNLYIIYAIIFALLKMFYIDYPYIDSVCGFGFCYGVYSILKRNVEMMETP